MLLGALKSRPVPRLGFWGVCLGGAGFVPYFSAGFFTKEAVLESLRAADLEGFGIRIPGGALYAVVLAVESLSALYLFRLLGYLSGDDREAAYSGEGHHGHGILREKSRVVRGVLLLLTLAAPVFAAFSGGPALLRGVTGGRGIAEAMHWAHVLPGILISALLAAGSFLVFSQSKRREAVAGSLLRASGFLGGAAGPLQRKFYFDDFYAFFLLFPLKGAAWLMRLVLENIFIGALGAAGWAAEMLSLLLRRLQTGRVQHYAAGILLAAAVAAYFLLRS
jgi:hypothetical protein